MPKPRRRRRGRFRSGRRSSGEDHPDVADSLDTLADVFREQGRDAEAEPLYRRALAITEKSPDASAEDIACSLTNLGNCLLSLEKYEETERLYLRSLALWEKARGPDDIEVARR